MPVASLATAVTAVVVFALVLWKVHVIRLGQSLTSHTFAGVSAMFDSTLDDLEKESAVRQAGLRLLLGACQIIWRFGLALLSTAVPIYLAATLGLSTVSETLGVLLRLDFIIVVSVIAVAAAWIIARLQRGTARSVSSAESQDGGNKIVHTLAFAGPRMLRLASGLDDRLFAAKISRVQDTRPIFITSLARGGTTAILNAMHGLPDVATHLYRDMPFITAPMLWSKFGGSNRDAGRRKRAHGDGLEIDLDSPEAFDEVFWMLNWPEKYSDRGIELWTSDDARDRARDQMVRNFKKIIYLRRSEDSARQARTVRYLSKNNANIARLRLLPKLFPGCDIVVPLRHPAAHAASLHRQHENFSALHAEDPFVMRYMRDIGHFEFGALHRPILFDGIPPVDATPDQPDYWLAYWIAAFKDVGSHAKGVHIVTQDDLRSAPEETMGALLASLDLAPSSNFASFFRPEPDPRPNDLYSASLLREAHGIYEALSRKSVGMESGKQ